MPAQIEDSVTDSRRIEYKQGNAVPYSDRGFENVKNKMFRAHKFLAIKAITKMGHPSHSLHLTYFGHF